jgi:hypothetical protein
MTDARFPERWLNDRRLRRLSDPGFRLFMVSLTWSVSNRTDGVLYPDDLALLADIDPARGAELEKAGLWRREKDCWLVVDFENTQTTREQLEGLDHKRRMDRERKARQRARERAGQQVASRVTSDVTQRTGQDRPGRNPRPREVRSEEEQEHAHERANDDPWSATP